MKYENWEQYEYPGSGRRITRFLDGEDYRHQELLSDEELAERAEQAQE